MNADRMVIETLAADEAQLREEVLAYRELAHAAVARLAALQTRLEREHDLRERLVDENRELRACIMRLDERVA